MAKLTITSPIENDRVQANATLNILFTVDSFLSSKTTCALTIKVADNAAFTSATIVTPTKIEVSTDSGKTWATYVSSNIITKGTSVGGGRLFRVTYAYPNISAIRYLKLVNVENNVTYESATVLVTSLLTLDFKVAPIVKDVMPIKIQIKDKKVEIDAAHLTYNVQVCNNALDASPTWENATTAYLNGDFYEFTNTAKINANWAVAFKMTITKSVFSAGVEISEIYIGTV
jgi:hypothetical protein